MDGRTDRHTGGKTDVEGGYRADGAVEAAQRCPYRNFRNFDTSSIFLFHLDLVNSMHRIAIRILK